MPTVSEQLVSEAQERNLPVADVDAFWQVFGRGLLATQADRIPALQTCIEEHAQTLLAPLQLETNAILTRRQAALDAVEDIRIRIAAGEVVTIPTEEELCAIVDGGA